MIIYHDQVSFIHINRHKDSLDIEKVIDKIKIHFII